MTVTGLIILNSQAAVRPVTVTYNMTTTTRERPKANWLTMILWPAANLIGFSLAGVFFHNFPLAFAFPPNLSRLGSFSLAPALLGGLMFGAVPALLLGFLQRLTLRRHLPVSRWWIVSASVGMGLMHFLSDGFENARDLSIAVSLSGLVVGVMQWLLLRAQLPESVWCIPASLIGWYVGWVIGIATLDAIGLRHVPWIGGLDVKQHGILGIATGITYSLTTAPTLIWLLRKRS